MLYRFKNIPVIFFLKQTSCYSAKPNLLVDTPIDFVIINGLWRHKSSYSRGYTSEMIDISEIIDIPEIISSIVVEFLE